MTIVFRQVFARDDHQTFTCCSTFIGLTGMKNIGNSCYLNAALQALSNW